MNILEACGWLALGITMGAAAYGVGGLTSMILLRRERQRMDEDAQD